MEVPNRRKKRKTLTKKLATYVSQKEYDAILERAEIVSNGNIAAFIRFAVLEHIKKNPGKT